MSSETPEPSWKQRGEEARRLGFYCDEALKRYSVPLGKPVIEFMAGYWGLDMPVGRYESKGLPELLDDF